jgi:16S rRNA G966 N2-methylase RsmD
VEVRGDEVLGKKLAAALAVAPSGEDEDEPERAHVHGFHSYAARMHPVTAARLVGDLSSAGEAVLDPFCGSGTVLVESMILGRRALGNDVNPIAVSLSAAKTRPRTPEGLARIVEAADAARAFADRRRRARSGATRRYGEDDVTLFEPHVLLELDSLRAALDTPERTRDLPLRTDLLLVLSAIVVKLSRQRGDTGALLSDERRTRAGYAAELFARKAEEYARRLAAFAEQLPAPRPAVDVATADARALAHLASRSMDAVVTSPPYAGTYDYVDHHALRMRWLGLDAGPFERAEWGARRRYARLDAEAADALWQRELADVLASLVRVTKRGSNIVLLVADSATRTLALRADAAVREAARRNPELHVLATASQERPHFHQPTERMFARAPRREHAILLVKRKPGTGGP